MSDIKDVKATVAATVESMGMRVLDDKETAAFLAAVPTLAEQEAARVDAAEKDGRVVLKEGDPGTVETMKLLSEEARTQTLETLPAFLTKLTQDYQHDYGTICKAIAVAAVAAANAVDASPQGGITGFQAGAVMWEFIRGWQGIQGPLRLVRYGEMLYPQCADKFATTIPRSVFAELQRLAGERLAAGDYAHPDVRAHWQSIVDGVVPFGYMLVND